MTLPRHPALQLCPKGATWWMQLAWPFALMAIWLCNPLHNSHERTWTKKRLACTIPMPLGGLPSVKASFAKVFCRSLVTHHASPKDLQKLLHPRSVLRPIQANLVSRCQMGRFFVPVITTKRRVLQQGKGAKTAATQVDAKAFQLRPSALFDCF